VQSLELWLQLEHSHVQLKVHHRLYRQFETHYLQVLAKLQVLLLLVLLVLLPVLLPVLQRLQML
jgi:hypothetical protein